MWIKISPAVQDKVIWFLKRILKINFLFFSSVEETGNGPEGN